MPQQDVEVLCSDEERRLDDHRRQRRHDRRRRRGTATTWSCGSPPRARIAMSIASTGRRGHGHRRVANGRLVEQWGVADITGLMRPLGAETASAGRGTAQRGRLSGKPTRRTSALKRGRCGGRRSGRPHRGRRETRSAARMLRRAQPLLGRTFLTASSFWRTVA